MVRNSLKFLAASLVIACQSPGVSTELPDEAFLAISRDAQTADALLFASSDKNATDTTAVTKDNSFYIAVKKTELANRWFLSAYLKQVFPSAVSGGAARSLGTQIVSFKVQNDKLFVFAADDNKTTSDTFDPQVLIDAYPLVTDNKAFKDAKGYDKYVLFDPASGESSLGFFGEYAGEFGVKFTTELKFMQRYRAIADGITFEMVFSGTTDASGANPESAAAGENNQLKTSGTLGIGLRRYKEGAGFVRAPAAKKEFFFRSDLQLVPNTGAVTAPFAKWNIKRGMKPIRWVISDQFKKYKADPDFADVDIVGAIKAGITNWNETFGFTALTAEVADISDSYADDDVNYLIYDGDPSYGAAFANWRTNPNTGEIRGASVYFNAGWIDNAMNSFKDDVAPTDPGSVPSNNRPRLAWGGLSEQRICEYDAPGVRRAHMGGEANLAPKTSPAALAAKLLTKKQKVESFLTHVVIHEIGHTLGLRHNFKGSLVPPSSSVMDYLTDEDSFPMAHPGAYDTDALNFLYGISDEAPLLPFCTDQDTVVDPTCNRFDSGADPFAEFYAPFYRQVLEDYLAGKSPTAPNTTLNSVLGFVRAAVTPEERTAALNAAIEGIAVGATPDANKARADVALRNVLKRLYLDAPDARGAFKADPAKKDPATWVPLLTQVAGALANSDGIRGFETRRLTVDILKKLQDNTALALLSQQEGATANEVTAAPNVVVKAQADDLLKRIQAALTPYFN